MSYGEMVHFVKEQMQETQELKKKSAAVEKESRDSSRNTVPRHTGVTMPIISRSRYAPN
jgi:hypothetical protein